ncbi:hypothetical protein CBP13_23055, partial [Fischerella thermalis WC441]
MTLKNEAIEHSSQFGLFQLTFYVNLLKNINLHLALRAKFYIYIIILYLFLKREYYSKPLLGGFPNSHRTLTFIKEAFCCSDKKTSWNIQLVEIFIYHSTQFVSTLCVLVSWWFQDDLF